MKRTTKAKAQPLPDSWVVTARFRSESGRWVEKGTELTVNGIRGRVKFVKHVRIVVPHDEAQPETLTEWIDVIDKHSHFRSVRPSAIKTVHWTKKTRGNSA